MECERSGNEMLVKLADLPPSLISVFAARSIGSYIVRIQGFFMRTAKTAQNGRAPSLICVFTGRTGQLVGFVVLRLI